MLELRNKTPLPAAIVPWLDHDGTDSAGVIVKSTFTIGRGRSVALADEQAPLLRADQFRGDPAETSLGYASDVSPPKLGTDLVLLGHAYAPRARATSGDVTFQVGRYRKVARVSGDRRFTRGGGRWLIAGPVAFESIPLTWERAFGGRDLSHPSPDRQAVEWRNPVGAGFVASRNSSLIEGLALPNIEDPRTPITTPESVAAPCGFGFTASHWLPRRGYAGTYDDAWKRTRCPYLPRDFDPRFYNAAPEDQIATPHLSGGEPVEVQGASADGPVAFALPELRFRVEAVVQGRSTEHTMALDTLVVEPDQRRVLLTWKASVPCARRFLSIERVTISIEGLA
jgi:hypothetical protein